MDRRGGAHTRGREQYEVGYRDVRGPLEEWFLAAAIQV